MRGASKIIGNLKNIGLPDEGVFGKAINEGYQTTLDAGQMTSPVDNTVEQLKAMGINPASYTPPETAASIDPLQKNILSAWDASKKSATAQFKQLLGDLGETAWGTALGYGAGLAADSIIPGAGQGIIPYVTAALGGSSVKKIPGDVYKLIGAKNLQNAYSVASEGPPLYSIEATTSGLRPALNWKSQSTGNAAASMSGPQQNLLDTSRQNQTGQQTLEDLYLAQ